MWLCAIDKRIAWIETPWENDREKRLSTLAIRELLSAGNAHAYSFMTECWVGVFADMSEKDAKHWMAFADENGVRALPPSMRDDALMIMTHDRAGGVSIAKYLVTERHGKGPNFIGPRQDEGDELTGMAGPMFNLFEPARSTNDARAFAMKKAAAKE